MPPGQDHHGCREIAAKLESILKGRVVVLGVGNPLRGDDGFGPALIDRLKDRTDAVCLDAGTAPENYLGAIVKEDPDTILIVDAVHLNRAPGQVDILTKDDIAQRGFTTHDISPRLVIEYLEQQTNAGIHMLAVQPESVAFGAGMSASVERTLAAMCDLLSTTT